MRSGDCALVRAAASPAATRGEALLSCFESTVGHSESRSRKPDAPWRDDRVECGRRWQRAFEFRVVLLCVETWSRSHLACAAFDGASVEPARR